MKTNRIDRDQQAKGNPNDNQKESTMNTTTNDKETAMNTSNESKGTTDMSTQDNDGGSRAGRVTSKSVAAVLEDARGVISEARAHLADFKALDAKKKLPLLGLRQIEECEGDVAGARRAAEEYRYAVLAHRAATADADEAREVVRDEISSLRLDVTIRLADRPRIAAALGLDRQVNLRTRGHTLATAVAVEGGFERSEDHALLAEAGVTAARIASLRTARLRLEEAEGAQRVARTTQTALRGAKTRALRKVRANTTFIRRVVTLAFRKLPDVREHFRVTLPHRDVRKRRTPAAPPNQAAALAPRSEAA